MTNAMFVHTELVSAISIVEGNVNVEACLCSAGQDTNTKGYVSRPIYSSSQICRVNLLYRGQRTRMNGNSSR